MADVATRAGANGRSRWRRRGAQPIPSDAVRDALGAHPDAKVFAMVHAETSTGVAQPVDEIAAIVRDHGALFVLDTVTSLAGMPVTIDDWGVDVAYSGTQKCLSVPPGLAPITYSERALETVRVTHDARAELVPRRRRCSRATGARIACTTTPRRSRW